MTFVDTSVVTVTAQTITCSLTGLSATATVTWAGPDQETISDGSDYTVDPGQATNGNQKSKLTIKQTKLSSLLTDQSTHTFTCTVKSGQYPTDSPEVEETMILTLLTFGRPKFYRKYQTITSFKLLLFCFSNQVTARNNVLLQVWKERTKK